MQAHLQAPEFSRYLFQDSSYGVLAEVSLCCPPPKGRFPTYYSPVRHFPLTEVSFSFDLHVWSTPPAFVLSQDQTLHCQKVYVHRQTKLNGSTARLLFSLTLLLACCPFIFVLNQQVFCLFSAILFSMFDSVWIFWPKVIFLTEESSTFVVQGKIYCLFIYPASFYQCSRLNKPLFAVIIIIVLKDLMSSTSFKKKL